MSYAPQSSELATPDFLASVAQLVGVVTTYDTNFLLAFFPFWLAKPRIG